MWTLNQYSEAPVRMGGHFHPFIWEWPVLQCFPSGFEYQMFLFKTGSHYVGLASLNLKL